MLRKRLRWRSVTGLAVLAVAGSFVPAVTISSSAMAAASAPGFSYTDFSQPTDLALNGGTAAIGAALRLTDTNGNEARTAWYGTAVSPTASFTSQVSLSLHDGGGSDNNGAPADGVAFVIQATPAGTAAVGGLGEGIGYSGLSPSVDVEFDDWQNGWDPDANHIAITTNGDETTSLSLSDPGFQMYGSPFNAWIVYDATVKSLSVYVSQSQVRPSTPTVSANVDLGSVLGAANPSYVGLTGGTGSNWQDADVSAWSYSQASTSNTMTAEPGSAIVPWVASVGSSAKLQLDLTKDNKDPFCPSSGNTCKPGPASTLAYTYFAKTTTFAVKLKNLSTGAGCDSTNTKAALVTPIQPGVGDQIGYQVAFDANCGKKGTPDYSGIVADIFVMDPAFKHEYSALPGGGSQGTDHLAQTLRVYAGVNAVTCLSAKSVTAVKDLLDISDYAELVADINSEEFAEKLVEIKAEDFEDLSIKPIPGTSSCAAEHIFAQAAVTIHVEAIAASHNGVPLHLDDQLSLNGKHSNYSLYIADPAGIGPSAGSEFPIVNLTGSEQDLMLVRAILAGLARTGLIST